MNDKDAEMMVQIIKVLADASFEQKVLGAPGGKEKFETMSERAQEAFRKTYRIAYVDGYVDALFDSTKAQQIARGEID